MTYRGKVKGGVVVLEPGARLDEGAEVVVEPVADRDEHASLREGLLKFAGTVKGLPSDMARNHDHYIHGTPKK
ncbi:MAG: hypothetical protein QUV05_00540 [Phycisphaerae bacterium]|jgi:hypothetical protein|nr:hypothetical protein [Phycisphaerae bacterium]